MMCNFADIYGNKMRGFLLGALLLSIVRTPLDWKQWDCLLEAYPDQRFLSYIRSKGYKSGIQSGVKLPTYVPQFEAEHKFSKGEADNHTRIHSERGFQRMDHWSTQPRWIPTGPHQSFWNWLQSVCSYLISTDLRMHSNLYRGHDAPCLLPPCTD